MPPLKVGWVGRIAGQVAPGVGADSSLMGAFFLPLLQGLTRLLDPTAGSKPE